MEIETGRDKDKNKLLTLEHQIECKETMHVVCEDDNFEW